MWVQHALMMGVFAFVAAVGGWTNSRNCSFVGALGEAAVVYAAGAGVVAVSVWAEGAVKRRKIDRVGGWSIVLATAVASIIAIRQVGGLVADVLGSPF